MHALGVLPDEISRDSRAESWLIFVDLASGATVEEWLEHVATPALETLSASGFATCTTGFGSSLFDKAALPLQRPVGLSAELPSSVPTDSNDVIFYVFATSDAVVAAFLRAIGLGVGTSKVAVERGYQRTDGREVFGQLDGLRNIPVAEREAVAFVGPDQPDEPPWAAGGSYMTYLKIEQNVAAWLQMDADAQAQILGRRLDGSRLDLPDDTPAATEGTFDNPTTPPECAHIRKAGPRGATNDPVRIFRRGTPFAECDVTGAVIEGLQFVSYEASIDDFLTILERWMLNATFPSGSPGVDSLFDPAKALTKILKGGVYFAVPHDDRYIGAGIFDPVGSASSGIVIRLVVDGPTGMPSTTAALDGATFTITNASGVVLDTLTTDAAGHAASGSLPVGEPLTVTQTTPPSASSIGSQPAQTVTLERCTKSLVLFTDTTESNVYGA